MNADWLVERRRGTAQELHDLAASEPIDRRRVVVHEVSGPALVLGSTQDADAVDVAGLERDGIELARRRSGGGAVLLRPGDHVWVDLAVPVDDPLHHDDVERATWWVGEAWAAALAVGGRAELHRHGVTDRAAGTVACFAALGPGELSVDGRKVLGLSQRRTRLGARFQCVAYRRWDPADLLGRLSPDVVASGSVAGALVDHAAAVVDDGWTVDGRLLPALP